MDVVLISAEAVLPQNVTDDSITANGFATWLEAKTFEVLRFEFILVYPLKVKEQSLGFLAGFLLLGQSAGCMKPDWPSGLPVVLDHIL